MHTPHFTEKNITIDGLRIHYREWPGNETAVILHGWGGSGASWIAVANLLSKNGYGIIVPDLPGFGKSDSPRMAWTLKEYGDFVKEFLHKLGLQKPICIAHSFGGRIVFKLVSEEKELFSKYILAGIAPIVHPPSLKTRILGRISTALKPVFNLPGIRHCKKIAQKIIYKIAGTRDYLDANKVMKETFLLTFRDDMKEHIKKLDAPTLLLWGEKDTYVPVSDAHFLHEHINGSQLITYPQGGHGLHLNLAENFAKDSVAFLNNK